MSRVWDVPVHDTTRVRDVRVAAEAACARAGLDSQRTAVGALVATELATNLLKHAGGGRIVINLAQDPDIDEGTSSWVQVTSLDHGPGIPDVEAALRDGCTTVPASLGAGLGTCLRVSNTFDLHSRRGQGTVAVARVGPAPAARARTLRPGRGVRAGGINVSLAQDEYSGDAFGCVRSGSRLTLMLADGLGHGIRAAQAAVAAVAQLRNTAGRPPDEVLRSIHGVLRSTRGAAVVVGQADVATGRFSFCGVGNVGARLHSGGTWRPLLSHPGIVGARLPASLPLQHGTWRADSLLLVHSDGLPSRWTPPTDPQLLTLDPALIAAVVLREASSAARPLHDDTSVAVLTNGHRTYPDDRP
ncbi:SpoIIE family protein phosphatase [Streptomyces thinghirensis]|uniref:SpoIIE family protein phosphatase n=1 Tax=Streptomyces thinghirensis TaxID=551547 RepID=A0ABP9T365_9ACTN